MKAFSQLMVLVSSMIFLISGCNKSSSSVQTLEARGIAETKALLCGRINPPDIIESDYEFGFFFSTDSVFTDECAVKIQSKYYDEDYLFFYQLEQLCPDTKYFYQSYMINQKRIYRGEIKSIVTLPSGITLSCDSFATFIGAKFLISATLKGERVPIIWNSDNKRVATVNNKGMVTALSNGTAHISASVSTGIATCIVNVVEESEIEHSGVDLGLSVKWAALNVGSSVPTDYGSYFAWGETKTKKNYYLSVYKWCNSTSYKSLRKYNSDQSCGIVDNKTNLDMKDDAAHVKWGHQWRMPTKEEFDELINNCTWVWTTLNGVNGYIVTSKKDGFSERSIFLPSAGYNSGFTYDCIGHEGGYWSGSIGSISATACALIFDSSNHKRDESFRHNGRSVRPVCP